jgi:hypothetical protein
VTQDTLATADDTELGQRRRSCAAYEQVLAAQDKELTAARAEIERLRGLLREAVDVDNNSYLRIDAAMMRGLWLKRVREALGE